MNSAFSISSNIVSGPFIRGRSRAEEDWGCGQAGPPSWTPPHTHMHSPRTQSTDLLCNISLPPGKSDSPIPPPTRQEASTVSLTLLLEQGEDRNTQASSDFCPLKARPKCSLFWADGVVPIKKGTERSREKV